MPKRSSKSKQRPDINELAKDITERATNPEPEEQEAESQGKNPAAVALGRLGGLVGGKARARRLSKKRRKQIARKAARTRWKRSI